MYATSWTYVPTRLHNFQGLMKIFLQDPDVMRSPLPVFHRPPSSERDTTVMRPPAHDGSCLLAPRCQSANGVAGGSNPAADYLVPLAHSIEMHSSPSGGSAEHLLGKNNILNYNLARKYKFIIKHILFFPLLKCNLKYKLRSVCNLRICCRNRFLRMFGRE